MKASEFRRQFYFSKTERKFLFERYSWPGGYPRFLVLEDGGCLCANCVDDERGLIHQSALRKLHDGWRPLSIDVNWEDPRLYCDNCNQRIESAYAEDEVRERDEP